MALCYAIFSLILHFLEYNHTIYSTPRSYVKHKITFPASFSFELLRRPTKHTLPKQKAVPNNSMKGTAFIVSVVLQCSTYRARQTLLTENCTVSSVERAKLLCLVKRPLRTTFVLLYHLLVHPDNAYLIIKDEFKVLQHCESFLEV